MMKNLLKIAFGLIMAICFGQNVGAEETDSPMFVREDCIWEYDYFVEKGGYVSHELFQYRFDGTEDVDGKTYHKLKNFHTIKWYIYGPSGVEETDVDETEALIREENGKVWMRNTSDYPLRNILNGEESSPEEILLYDFSAKVGDKITALVQTPYITKNSMICDFIIKEIKEDSAHRSFIATKDSDNQDDTFEYVEGVGTIGSGSILGPCVYFLGGTVGSWDWWTFNNQYDLDGNVIFAGKGNNPPPAAPLFVREDCIWEFYKSVATPQEDIVELSKYRFDGTKEMKGIEYNILKKFHTTRWHVDDTGPYQLEEEDTDVIVGYLRETNGLVKMYNSLPVVMGLGGKWNEVDNRYDYTEYEIKGNNELTIYNFFVLKDESFDVWCRVLPYYTSENAYMVTKYKSTGTKEENGTEIFTSVSCYPPTVGDNDFPVDFRYVAGTGNIGAGTILGPELHLDIAVGGPLEENAFNNQYDLNGNVIFAGKGVKVPEIGHVSTVNSDNKRDIRMYDLMGREIKNPLRGTIYMQNGHKMIAR